MRTISILNFKGGTAKSTLAVNVGHALALDGQRVLLVDCDMQANASMILAQVREPTLTDVLRGRAKLREAIQPARERLDIVPADSALDTATKHIVAEGRKAYYTLKRQMAELTGYDVVLFDHAPSYTAVTEAALLASTEMLIPCELSPYAIRGLLAMFAKLDDVMVDHALTMTGIVPFKLDLRYDMHKTYLVRLREQFGERVLTPVRTDAAAGKAQSFNKTIFEYDPQCRAAQDIRTVAREITKEVVTA